MNAEIYKKAYPDKQGSKGGENRNGYLPGNGDFITNHRNPLGHNRILGQYG